MELGCTPFADKLSQTDETLSSFKRPQMNYSNVLKPSLLGYFLFIPSWMVGKLMTQFHSDTQTLLSVPRRGKGKVGEKQRTRERSSRQMTSCWCGSTFLCVSYLSSTLTFFFFPRIWKHGLVIERLVKGFCFIMHWNYFRMVKRRQPILFFVRFKQQHV